MNEQAILATFLLGSTLGIVVIWSVAIYAEYIKMRRYIKYTKQQDKYETFTSQIKV